MADSLLKSVETSIGGVPANFDAFHEAPVFVGDNVTAQVSMFGKKIILGRGLEQKSGEKIVATQAGLLRFEAPNVYWVEHYDQRYLPRLEDNVIGIVKDSFAEHYNVDIHSSSTAQLPTLAFDGATKRNRPTYTVGTLVYARVAQVHKDMDPELSCMVVSGPRKDWMTGQSVYGELKGGYVFGCSLSLASRLLDPECPVLLALSKWVAFEIAIGLNGFVWVNAAKPKDISVITNAIKQSESLMTEQILPMVKSLLKSR